MPGTVFLPAVASGLPKDSVDFTGYSRCKTSAPTAADGDGESMGWLKAR
jgi:hypothetical protein